MHDGVAALTVAVGHEVFLGLRRVGEDDVCLALLAHRQRLAGADGDSLDVIVVLVLELRSQHVKEAAVLRAGSGGEDQFVLAGAGGEDEEQEEGEEKQQDAREKASGARRHNEREPVCGLRHGVLLQAGKLWELGLEAVLDKLSDAVRDAMEAPDDIVGFRRQGGVAAVAAAAMALQEAHPEAVLDLAQLIPGGAIGDAQAPGGGGQGTGLADGLQELDAPLGEGYAAIQVQPDLGAGVHGGGGAAHSVRQTLA